MNIDETKFYEACPVLTDDEVALEIARSFADKEPEKDLILRLKQKWVSYKQYERMRKQVHADCAVLYKQKEWIDRFAEASIRKGQSLEEALAALEKSIKELVDPEYLSVYLNYLKQLWDPATAHLEKLEEAQELSEELQFARIQRKERHRQAREQRQREAAEAARLSEEKERAVKAERKALEKELARSISAIKEQQKQERALAKREAWLKAHPERARQSSRKK